MLYTNWLSILFAFGVSLYMGHLLQPVAKHLGLIDQPGGRKHHISETPLVGGIAVFLGFAFAILTLDISLAPFRSLIAGSTLLIIVGVLDDLHEIPPYSRLIGQALASLFLVFWGGVHFTALGNILGTGNITLVNTSTVFSIFIIIASINAMNMLDGIDGLLGCICVIMLLTLMLAGIHVMEPDIALIAAIVISALAGFLFYNFPFRKRHAKIFMGDSGSMFLGFIIICTIMYLSNAPRIHQLNLGCIVWIMALPIFDIINVTLRRLMLKQNPLHATRDHVHHFFQKYNFNLYQTLWSLIFITLITYIIGLIGFYTGVTPYYLFYSFTFLFLILSILYQYQWIKLTKASS